ACTSVNDGEAACAQAGGANALHCLTAGNGAGSCVECRDNNDCPTREKAICDTTTHVCRPCSDETDCASKVCDLFSETTTNHGTCIDQTMIYYVDDGCVATRDGMINTPYCKIT